MRYPLDPTASLADYRQAIRKDSDPQRSRARRDQARANRSFEGNGNEIHQALALAISA
jgi:hypothetical protein